MGLPKLLTAMAALVLVVAFVGRGTETAKDEFRFDAATLKDTTLWTKVNNEPYRLFVQLDALCALPTTAQYEAERKHNPHKATYITVYVNKIGRESMLAREVQQFPEGSVIVKEKIGNRVEGGKPLLYTIMRKRERGYNPTVGDWEFAVVGANGTDLKARGKLEPCQSCHKDQSKSDFIFRPYLKSE